MNNYKTKELYEEIDDALRDNLYYYNKQELTKDIKKDIDLMFHLPDHKLYCLKC